MQQLSGDQQQQQIQRFYRQELQQLAQTRDALRAQHRPADQSNSQDSDSDYDSSNRLSDGEDDDREGLHVEAADMQTHIPASNVGYQLLLKMGWKAGTGLGQNATGRTAPIPIERKQDVLGIGKQEVDMWYNELSTSKRKTLEVERQAEETEEEKTKREKQVQQNLAVQAELEMVKSAFYCALCDKQYERISDYEVHLSSYDHNHKKRFKEMKETSRAGAASTTNKIKEKERRREERELAKLQEAAMKRAGGSAALGGSAPQSQIGSSTSATTLTTRPGISSSGSAGFQPVKLGGFQPVKSSGFQPVSMSNSSSSAAPVPMEGVLTESTSAAAPTRADSAPVSSGFQPVKMSGFQPVKMGGLQPARKSAFQSVKDDDPVETSASSSATEFSATSTSASASAPAPSGFQPVKLGGFKPLKIGGFQLKKPGGR
ncbi:G patch domain-containing protein 8 [Mortierella claussenii]|nr:G patch domain-containing protein 8 [Mortierella claussenii]